MSIFLGYMLLILIALLGARWSFRPISIPFFPQNAWPTVTKYLVVGIALGPYFTNILNTDMLGQLMPVIHLILGWIGFLVGMQLEWRQLRRFPSALFFSTFVHVVIAFGIVFGAFFLLWPLFGISQMASVEGALFLAAVGVCSTPTYIAIANRYFYPSSPLIVFIKFVTSFAAVFGIVLFGFWTFVRNNLHLHEMPLPIFQWLMIAGGLGIILSIIFHSFSRLSTSSSDRLAFTIGILIFSGGLSVYLRLPPLFVNMIAGMIFVNVNKKSEEIFSFLLYSERVVYLVLLIISGAMWKFSWIGGLSLAFCYFTIRFFGMLGGGALAIMAPPSLRKLPRFCGVAFVSQGGVAVALIVNLQLFYSGDIIRTLVSAIYFAFVFNEIMGSHYLDKLLMKQEGLFLGRLRQKK